MAECPAPTGGLLLTYLVVSRDVARSRRFYTEVLGGETVLDTDGTGQSASGTASDNAGNGASATVSGINIDSRPPQTDINNRCDSTTGFCKNGTVTLVVSASDPPPPATTGVTTSGVRELRASYTFATTPADPSLRTYSPEATYAWSGTPITVTIPTTNSGTATVKYYSVDKADNKELANYVSLNFDNIATQRNLNDKGKALATAFGDALRQIGIPIGKVYTSKFNRAYETAVLAGFKDIEKTADLTEGGLVVSPNENSRRAEAFRKMLGVAPKAGTNTILITHKPNIVDALGKDWFDVKEGEASIFHPENGSSNLVARVQMDEWSRIAAAK